MLDFERESDLLIFRECQTESERERDRESGRENAREREIERRESEIKIISCVLH